MEDLGDCAQTKLYPPENKKPSLAVEEKEKAAAAMENVPPAAMEEEEKAKAAAVVENVPPVAMEKVAGVENPPLTNAELGLCAPYLERWPLEDADEIDENIYYMDSEGKQDRPDDIRGTHDKVKRFLKQVRESRGYDVDWYPPPCICSPFIPIDLQDEEVYRVKAIEVGNFAIEHINAETMVKFGKRYVFVDVEKAVDTLSLYMLLTITAKELDAEAVAADDVSDAPVKTLQAMVWVPPGRGQPLEFEEWKFKPGCA